MEISKKELKKISRKFRTLGSNVMNSHFEEINSAIFIFVNYIKSTDILIEYIKSLRYTFDNLDSEIQESSGYSRNKIFLGESSEEQTAKIYSILNYIAEHKEFQTFHLGWGYTSSKRFQDMTNEFGKRIVNPFIVNISDYLMNIATDMGYDEESRFMINVSGGNAQVNIANDNGVVNSSQYNNADIQEISELISNIKSQVADSDLEDNLKEIINVNLQQALTEVKEISPKPNIIQTSLKTVKELLTSTVSLATATEFVQKIIEIVSKWGN